MAEGRSLLRILIARCCCALLAVFAAGAVLALDQNLSVKNLAGAYLGLDVVFSLIGILTNLRLGFKFLASYLLLTVIWVVLAALALFELG